MLRTWLEEGMQNHILFTSVIAWATAETTKAFIRFFSPGKKSFRELWGSGGMPSAHSATVSSLAASVGLFHGFDGYPFAIAAVLALVVMYDACGVRLAASRHAAVLNNLQQEEKKPLRESLGHTQMQVLAGGTLGVLVAFFAYLIIS